LAALLLVVGVLAPAFAQQPFADVPLNHWAYNAVNKMAETGILEGYPSGLFSGKQSMTRYEFAQAIARMMDRMEQLGGVPGPPGPPGPAGAAGSGAGLTPEQKALLDKLAKEFAPELKALRSDLESLTRRVEDLEAVPPVELPAISIGGDISLRAGLYGTSLGVEDVEASGYPFFAELEGGDSYLEAISYVCAPYGSINIPWYDSTYGWSDAADFPGGPDYIGVIPISDALKDAYKPSDFMTMRTRVVLSGELSDATDVNVTLLAGTEMNDMGSPLMDFMAGSSLWLTGNGVMDTVAVDEAWLKHQTRVLAPADLTVGKVYKKRGQGLLVDNSQEAVKAVGVDWGGSSLSWGALWGMLDREQFFGIGNGSVGLPTEDPDLASWTNPETSGQDNYNLYYLDWAISNPWNLGVNWLQSGLNQESGWSASLEGELYGLDFYGEYANLTDWPTGKDWNDFDGDGMLDAGEVELSESDAAWMAGLRWSNSAVCVTGEYGEVDAGYAFAIPGGGWSAINPLIASLGMYGLNTGYFNLPLSALHPNAEVDPHYINWVDRPLFLDPTNIARGWHVNVTFPTLLGQNTPVSISYADGDAYNGRYLSWLGSGGSTSGIAQPDKWQDADSVLVVKVSRQLSDCVSANLVYGRREAENVMSPQTVPLGIDAQENPIYATNDPIQVVRGEVCVAF
jgi:hypothetical protein